MPRKASAYDHAGKLKQQTLTGFLHTSPPSSPSKSATEKRKRRLETPSSEEHSQVTDEESNDSDVGAIHFEADAIEPSDEDASPRRAKRRRIPVVTDDLDEQLPMDDEENVEAPVPRTRKGKASIIVDSEDELQPRRRKLVKGVRPPTPSDDEDDIDENQILENRLRTRGRQTKYQKNLEKLKSLKHKGRGEVALQSSSEELSEDSGSESDDDPTNSAEDDDFIVEDDSRGALAIQLPAAFSMNTHQDLSHHFKVICQLFVHMAVRPPHERRPFMQHVLKKEEYFSVPLQVTRRKLCGMRDSLVTSSIWGPEFKKPLEKYPELTLLRMEFGLPGCDACSLGSRTSTILARVSGTPYNEYDFEVLFFVNGRETEAQTEARKQSGKNFISVASVRRAREYSTNSTIGRFVTCPCQRHLFTFLQYSLYNALQFEVTAANAVNKKFVKVAFVGGALPPRDAQDADKLMDWLDQRGIIDMEWQKVRRMMEETKNLAKGDIDDVE
ncbi:hypothetical protein ID866_1471 [Astraeus odoratus]|nr:hypothetical protein ID866_1471 [Astraeus odoratus]